MRIQFLALFFLVGYFTLVSVYFGIVGSRENKELAGILKEAVVA
jgi:hypothetical protein